MPGTANANLRSGTGLAESRCGRPEKGAGRSPGWPEKVPGSAHGSLAPAPPQVSVLAQLCQLPGPIKLSYSWQPVPAQGRSRARAVLLDVSGCVWEEDWGTCDWGGGGGCKGRACGTSLECPPRRHACSGMWGRARAMPGAALTRHHSRQTGEGQAGFQGPQAPLPQREAAAPCWTPEHMERPAMEPNDLRRPFASLVREAVHWPTRLRAFGEQGIRAAGATSTSGTGPRLIGRQCAVRLDRKAPSHAQLCRPTSPLPPRLPCRSTTRSAPAIMPTAPHSIHTPSPAATSGSHPNPNQVRRQGVSGGATHSLVSVTRQDRAQHPPPSPTTHLPS